MTHAVGTVLDGIRSLDDLRLRCFVCEATKCWIWRRSVSQGSPRVHIVLASGPSIARGRRAALSLRAGKKLPSDLQVFAKSYCANALCVNPDHAQAKSKAERGAILAASGRLKGQAHRIAANTINARKRARISIEVAREIRAAEGSITAIAKRWGVNPSLVGYIRDGSRWKEAGSSVFGWRP